ncbi:MAG: rRNA maturation RNase YbeY [Clostridia bacterium]|nr:rRNA maturation RNase YbeY [Clostridia bacterium]
MGRLYIESLSKKIKLTHIANAVYKTLEQKDDLKAELIFVSGEEIRRLNYETRKVDGITDVLSYPSLDGVKGEILKKKDYPTELDGRYLFIGSIVVCEDKIKEQAKEIGHSYITERTYLIVHGLMHLFGYDHLKEEDKKEMRDKEKKALKLLGVEQ